MNMLKKFLGSFNLKEFVGSKKAKAWAIYVITVITGWLSIDLPEELKAEAAGLVLAAIALGTGVYVWAQGKADAGKEAAKAAHEATAVPNLHNVKITVGDDGKVNIEPNTGG